jgi:vancomycin resistance protein VanJ
VAKAAPEHSWWRPTWAGAVAGCVWLYVVAVLAVWLLIRLGGDRWWLATVMLFGPRWIYGLPLLLLVPAAALVRRRLLLPLAASGIVVVGPLAGFCLPWGRLLVPAGPVVRILTCNVDGSAVNPDALSKLVEDEQPDVVALQECWGGVQYRWPAGWYVRQQGELLVASRYPIREVASVSGRRTGHVWPRLSLFNCIITTPDRDVDFCCVHMPSPRYGVARVLDRSTLLRPSRSGLIDEEDAERWRQSDGAAKLIENASDAVILAGDFNMPVDSTIYRQVWSRYTNAFSTSGLGFGHTICADVRGWRFGIRIDHVLTRSAWWPRRCWVGPDIGSDHLPLLADLVWDSRCDEQ